MNLTNFRLETDADGIALATWDMPGRSMNVFTDAVMEELGQIVDAVVADAGIKGCVIVSGKDNFSGGADLTMLQGLGRAYESLKAERGEEEAMRHFFEESRKLTLVFRKLETCGKPFAAAVNGICLGGAFELALACHYRVLSDDPKTRVGLPEIKVGLFPGGGGTPARGPPDADRRRPPDAVQGRADPPADGAEHGPRARGGRARRDRGQGQGLDSRRRLGRGPWDQPKFKAPSGKVYSPAGMMIWPPPTRSTAARPTTTTPPPRRSWPRSTRACNCRWIRPCGWKAATSPRSCAPRRRRR